jgi:hypothetical protein
VAHLRREERGQIILIAAFILAIAFVVLALVVNSAIFTENLATRDDVAGSQDALQYRHEVAQSVGDNIEAVNDNNTLALDGADESVTNISTQGGLQQSSLGRVVNVSFETRVDGTKIAQDNATRNFTSAGADADWTVAESVSDTRNFQINVTDFSELADVGDSNPFRVVANVTGGSVQWNMTIRGNTSSGNSLRIEVETPTGVSARCDETDVGDSAVVDVTGGTVAGDPCLALRKLQDPSGTEMWFAAGLSSYDIEFENGDNIQGTYSFIIGDGGSAGTGLVSGSDDHEPYFVTAIYSMTVNYAYYTPSVVYETEIEVAPEEVPP